jgi:hypothetical protein
MCTTVALTRLPRLAVLAVLVAAAAAQAAELPKVPALQDSVLRIARSTDGITFEGDALFAEAAACADVEVLPNGDLLTVYDAADGDEAFLVSARSQDGGKTWAPPRRIHMVGSPAMYRTARHADLLVQPDGRLRLFFSFSPNWTKNRRQQERRPSLMRAVGWADGIDGVHFKTALAYATQLKGLADLHTTAVRSDGEYRLFAQSLIADERGREQSAKRILESVATDGQHYTLQPRVQVPTTVILGAILNEGKALRAYATSSDGLIMMTSRDGRVWEAAGDVTPRAALFPAVARLADGSFLMLYTAEREAGSKPGAAGAMVPPAPREAWQDELDQHDPALAEEEAAEDEAAGQAADMTGEGPLPDELDEPLADRTGGFDAADVPAANFREPVDYIAWMQRSTYDRVTDNAYDVYAEFLPTPTNLKAAENWPKLVGLFQDDKYEGSIAPWSPADQAEWEQSHQAAASLMAQLRAAAGHRNYALKPETGSDASSAEGSDRLLISILLPHLGPHRNLVRQLMSDAWRAPDGRVEPETMVDAWETGLRVSDHMDQGSTLIERLVGTAEREMIRDTARRALAQGVFSSEDELETALQTLAREDRAARNVSHTLRGEYASVMDLTQHLFSPADADGQPQYNAARAKALAAFGIAEAQLDSMSKMTPDQVDASREVFERAYAEVDEMLATGYPDVRKADVDAWHERHRHATPLTEALLPRLSRVAQVRARSEASRRATQLAYGAELFKAREGRWPASIDELRDVVPADAAVDPMSGGSFGYRVDADGPRIWSAGENAVDDGGAHAARWGEREGDTTDDYVFYPPQDF